MRLSGGVDEYTVGFVHSWVCAQLGLREWGERVGCESGMRVGRESGVIEWENFLLFLYKCIKYLWNQINGASFKRYLH